jgi:hypothetical protein
MINPDFVDDEENTSYSYPLNLNDSFLVASS